MKYFFVILSLLGGAFSQVSLAMDVPTVVDEYHPKIPRKPIVIPSKVEITGIEATSFPNPQMEQSWRHLDSFTDQTIENFSKGEKKGIFFVHSLEDIMGVAAHFTKMWNANHPDDQRLLKLEADFHQLFTHQEFVEHYIPYVLASRPLISCSILFFNDQTAFTQADAFSPLSFIMHVPPECIAVVDRRDAGSPVNYIAPGDETGKDKLTKLRKYIDDTRKDNICLDALVRFPEFRITDYSLLANMNEVAILNCAISKGKTYRPSVIGALCSGNYGVSWDYGNAGRNILLKDEVQKFCIKENVPFLTVGQPEYISQEIAEKTVIQEWYGQKSSLQEYESHYGEKGKSENNHFHIRNKTFLLSNEQLEGYHLKRPTDTIR